MMNKKLKTAGLVTVLTMGLALATGCSKNDKVDQNEMIEKYAGYCELGEYKGIEYEASNVEVTDEIIQAEINYLLSSYATNQEATTEPAELGDKVNIDYTGSIDGVEFEGGSTEGMGSEITLGSAGFIDDFEEQIVGHKAGETFDIEVTFPEDYGKEELNGKDAVFEITLNNVYKQVLPEYNDEFVAENTYFSTTAELEDAIRESYAENDKSLNKNAVIEKVMDVSTVKEFPKQELENLIDTTIENVEEEASGYNMDVESYVKARYGVASMESFETYISGLAEDFLSEKIIICAIACEENITATDEEVEEEEKAMMESLGMTEEELYDVYTEEDVLYYALAEKVYDFLLENAVAVEAEAETATE